MTDRRKWTSYQISEYEHEDNVFNEQFQKALKLKNWARINELAEDGINYYHCPRFEHLITQEMRENGKADYLYNLAPLFYQD